MTKPAKVASAFIGMAWAIAAATGLGAERVPGSLYTRPEPVNLPPLMRTASGGEVRTAEEWENVRRPEILKFAAENIYGVRPVERPADLRFEPIEPDRAFPDIGAVRRRARASFSGPRGKWGFDMTLFLPDGASASSPAPAFVLICNRALEKFADIDLKERSEFFPVAEVVARGYAIAMFKNTHLALDDYLPYYSEDGAVAIQDPSFTNGFYACWAAERGERSWGAISAWAWGASRVLDWLETMGDIDARHVAVVGHSRGGKTSLWAAASDTRFAMACVNDSGCCGAKLNHAAVPCSETIEQDNNNNPHWFCRAYRQFNGRDAHLPFDQHWIAALVAPRLLYIASASLDYGAGPWGEFLTARHASPAWGLYGREGLVEDHVYAAERPFHGGCIGYHLRKGRHDLNLYDWKNYLDFADRHGWRSRRPAATSAVGAARPAPRAEVKIMTYNVCHCEGMDGRIDVARTAARINAENPDFACLQEIDWCTARVSGMDEPAELARRTGMHATFAKAIFYRGGQYGVMMLSREKPIDVVQLPLPGAEPRVLLVCEFRDCVVATSHLSVSGKEEREASVPIIRNAFAKYRKPVFFTGDWNATPSSDVLKSLGQFLTVLSDTTGRTFHGRSEMGPQGELLDKTPFCIDYVAVDAGHARDFEVVDTHVVEDRQTSDHAPVVATVSFARPELPEPAVVPLPVSLKLTGGQWRAQASDVTPALYKAKIDTTIPDGEGYRISITEKNGIAVTCADAVGAEYALQTLRQLAVWSWGRLAFPCCEIDDFPRFGWRGVHIDESRHPRAAL